MLFNVISNTYKKVYMCINYVLVFKATFLIAVGITSIPNKATSF